MSQNDTPPFPDKIRSFATGKDRIEYRAPDALKLYPGNARTHDEAQIEVLMGSIRAFGFVNPVLSD